MRLKGLECWGSMGIKEERSPEMSVWFNQDMLKSKETPCCLYMAMLLKS